MWWDCIVGWRFGSFGGIVGNEVYLLWTKYETIELEN